MTHIDRTIAEIPTMDRKARKNLLKNAEHQLLKKPDDPDALRLRDALRDYVVSANEGGGLISTGLLDWQTYAPGISLFLGFCDGVPVARIHMHANHTNALKEVYSVEVSHRTLPERFGKIDDARRAGEAAFLASR